MSASNQKKNNTLSYTSSLKSNLRNWKKSRMKSHYSRKLWPKAKKNINSKSFWRKKWRRRGRCWRKNCKRRTKNWSRRTRLRRNWQIKFWVCSVKNDRIVKNCISNVNNWNSSNTKLKKPFPKLIRNIKRNSMICRSNSHNSLRKKIFMNKSSPRRGKSSTSWNLNSLSPNGTWKKRVLLLPSKLKSAKTSRRGT